MTEIFYFFPGELATAGTSHHGNSRDFLIDFFCAESVHRRNVNEPVFCLCFCAL